MEGTKSVLEVLQQPAIEVVAIYALKEWLSRHQQFLASFQSVLYPINNKELERISNLKTPNQVVCICKMPQYTIDHQRINHSLTLYLDGIQDPGNMGSILRVADWFGIPYVWLSIACVDIYNPKVIQASMGAFLRVPTIIKQFNVLKSEFPDLPVFASVLNGQPINKNALPKNGVLVIGNEGQGIDTSIIQQANYLLTIPKGATGGAESLNAAVATGILCHVMHE